MDKIVIDKSLDTNFKFEIANRPGGENIKRCFACGTCTAGCPVFHVDHEYNPRKIIRMILLGMREEVLSSNIIWLCAQCYTCTANCPQDVDFSSIMMALRDMAVEEGYAPPDRLEKIEQIGMITNQIRRDCILQLVEKGNIAPEEFTAKVEEALKIHKTKG